MIPEVSAQSRFFQHDPTLIASLSQMVQSDSKDVPMELQSMAILTLEAIGRSSARINDVLSAMNASASHGVLLYLLRKVASNMCEDEVIYTQQFIEALLSFVTYLVSAHTSGGMIVSAGLVPILVSMMRSQQFSQIKNVAKVAALLDSTVYGWKAFDNFYDVGGREVLVDRIKEQVDLSIEHLQETNQLEEIMASKPTTAAATAVPHERIALIKSLFKFVLHLMQSSGNAEGMRNLIDTTLPASIGRVMQNSRVFGSSILALAVNIMATFIHNEPASLSVFQEIQLPNIFLDMVDLGIPPASDMIAAVPNAFGAICLNSTGLALFNERQPLSVFFRIFTMSEFVRILQDSEVAGSAGGAMDELMRHQPSLKDKIFEEIISVLDRVVVLGSTEAPEWLRSRPNIYLQAANTSSKDDDTETSSNEEQDPIKEKEKDNYVAEYIEITVKFLEGVLQNLTHCRDFIRLGGVDKLLRYFTLTTLPYDFASSHASYSLSNLFRSICEVDPNAVLSAVLNQLRLAREPLLPLLERGKEKSAFSSFIDITNESQLEEANRMFRAMVTMHGLVGLLSDIYAAPLFSQGRWTHPVIQVPMDDHGQLVLPMMGQLYRMCTWETIQLRQAVPASWNAAAEKLRESKMNSNTTSNSNTSSNQQQNTTAVESSSTTEEPTSMDVDTTDTTTTTTTSISNSNNETTKSTSTEEVVEPRLSGNMAAFTYLLTELPSCVGPLYQGIVRMLLPRRFADNAQRVLVLKIARSVAQSLKDIFTWGQPEQGIKSSELLYWTNALRLLPQLFVEERSNLSLYFIMVVAFARIDGLDVVFQMLDGLCTLYEQPAPEDSTSSPSSSTDYYKDIHLSMEAIIGWFRVITSSKLLHHSSNITSLTSNSANTDRQNDNTFDPYDHLVDIRYTVLPVIMRLWRSSFLVRCPSSMVRTLLQTIIQIMRADGEVNTRPDDSAASIAVSTLAALANPNQRSTLVVPSPPRPVVANEASIQVMVEMGFPRHAVITALQRTHNNVTRATDYILSHSELLMAEDTNETATATATDPATTDTTTDATTTEDNEAEEEHNSVAGEDMELVESTESSNTTTNNAEATEGTTEDTTDATTATDAATEDATITEATTEDNEAEAESTEPAPTVEEDPILPLPKRPAPRDELKQLRQDSEVTILDHALKLVDIIDDILVEVTELLLLMSKKRPDDIIHRLLDELVTIQEECATTTSISDTADKSAEKKTPEHRLFVRYQLLGHLLLKDHSMAQQIQQHIPNFLSILLDGVAQQTDRIVANSTSTTSSDTIPQWLAPLLAVVECFLSMASEPRPVKLSAELAEGGLEVTEADTQPIVKMSFEQKRTLLQHCINLLRSTNEAMLRVGSLRLLVMLSRDPHLAGELADPTYLTVILPSLKQGGLPTLHANQAYITMILRNVVESPQVLRDTMEREIMTYYNFHRPRALDVNNYLRTHTRVALRDPQMFIEATTAICRISHISTNGPSPQITLKKPADLASNNNDEEDKKKSDHSPEEAMSIDESTSNQSLSEEVKRESDMRAETVVQLLLQQLLRLKHEEATTSTSISDEKSQFVYVYRCFLLQVLVELLLAYPHCQHCILSVPVDVVSGKDQQMAVKSTTINGSTTSATSTSSSHQQQHPLIHHLLYDLLDHNASLGTRDAEAKKQMNLAICVDTFLVAMCTGSKDDKRVDNESLSQVRRTVLDGVWRALKEAGKSKLPLDVKYGRILTLSDLCHRLLTTTSSSPLSASSSSNNPSNSLANRDNSNNGNRSSELSGGLQMAQLMLDRGYVALLTNILAQVDLAFPMAKTVVNTLLRTLDPLAKSAIKLSRWRAATQSQSSTKKPNADGGEEEERPSLDVFIERNRSNLMDDTPDLYRHSSLGMYEAGGRLDHDYSFDEDDDEDDEGDTGNRNGLDDIFMSDRGVINEDDHNDIHDDDNEDDDNDVMDDDDDDDEDDDDEDDVDGHDTNEANYHYDTSSDRSEPDITTDEHDDVDSDEIDMEIVVHEPYDNGSLAVMSSSDLDNDTHPDSGHDHSDIDDDDDDDDIDDDDDVHDDEATISISGDLDSDAFDREDEFMRMIDENGIHEMLREGETGEGGRNNGSNRSPIDFSDIDWHQANFNDLFRSDDMTDGTPTSMALGRALLRVVDGSADMMGEDEDNEDEDDEDDDDDEDDEDEDEDGDEDQDNPLLLEGRFPVTWSVEGLDEEENPLIIMDPLLATTASNALGGGQHGQSALAVTGHAPSHGQHRRRSMHQGGGSGGRAYRLNRSIFGFELGDESRDHWIQDPIRYSPLEDENRFLRLNSRFRDVSRHPLLTTSGNTRGAANSPLASVNALNPHSVPLLNGHQGSLHVTSRLRDIHGWRTFDDVMNGNSSQNAVQLLEQLLGQHGRHGELEIIDGLGGHHERHRIDFSFGGGAGAGGGASSSNQVGTTAAAGATTTLATDGNAAPEPTIEDRIAQALLVIQESSPLSTRERWQQMVQLIYGDTMVEKASRLVNHLLNAMVPIAREEEQQRREEMKKEAEAEHAKLVEQMEARDAAKKATTEEDSQAEMETEAEAEPQQTEETTAAATTDESTTTVEPSETVEESASATNEPTREGTAVETTETTEAPVEVETPATITTADAATEATTDVATDAAAETAAGTATEEVQDSQASATSTERLTVMVNGQLVDISDTGIDPTFLEALPDDLREEVIQQHLREQRLAASRPAPSTTATNTVIPPTDTESNDNMGISEEFLDALPPDIRAEVLRDEQHQLASTTTPSQSAADMQFPFVSSSFAGANALFGQATRQRLMNDATRSASRSRDDATRTPSGVHATGATAHGDASTSTPTAAGAGVAGATGAVAAAGISSSISNALSAEQRPSAVHRDALSIVDRQGTAALMRLLFGRSQLLFSKDLYQRVILNLCENSKTRLDILSLLLAMIYEGSQTTAAFNASFDHLVQRANTTHTTSTNTATASSSASAITSPSRSMVTGSSTLATEGATGKILAGTSTNTRLSDQDINTILRHSLEMISHLVGANDRCLQYFLVEHEHTKRLGRERLPKSPLVTLLSLLDHPVFLNQSALLDQLMHLITSITRPLPALMKKEEARRLNSETTGSTTSTPVFKPPIIPENAYRAVSRVLALDICSMRAFQCTILTIQHLSALHGFDIMVDELVTNAARWSEATMLDLAQLLTVLGPATTTTSTTSMSIDEEASNKATPSSTTKEEGGGDDEVDQSHSVSEDDLNVVLLKFSPASARQAKLLRILKTIDYLYVTPSNKERTPSVEEKEKEKENVARLQAVYDRLALDGLWQRLGECLTRLQDNPDTTRVATVLLPLIESFMVVSKHTVLEAVANRMTEKIASAEMQSSSSAATSRDSRLTQNNQSNGGGGSQDPADAFFRFIEDHRKILNMLVRHNPGLMNGSFSLLIHNPKVLEFDNKRKYFSQQLHKRTPQQRVQHYSTLHLNVRRQYVFEDSYHQWQGRTGDEIKYGKLNVRFHGEEGVDAGGVSREWFQVLSRQMFNPNYALFVASAVDSVTYQPNPLSWANPDHLLYFKFIGRVIGKAIYDGRLLDCHFTRSFYKHMLARQVDYKDVEAVDPDYYKSLEWMLNNDITDVIDLTFSMEVDHFGVKKIIDLKPDGHNIPVTEENKMDYVKLVVEQRLTLSIRKQIDSFLAGFHEIIPASLVSIFNEQELELLISGLFDIDVDDWKNNTDYQGYNASAPQIQWFWRAVRSFNREERAKLVQFVTGTSKVPLEGFVALQGSGGLQKFQIHKDFGSTSRLPSAHTCFNQLDLPMYTSYEQLRSMLLLAIEECSTGFGFS
ncbi:hypothetical protein BDF22DRAFT_89497 [Syncephalis plumigaleata]|nr:hypothetical protein BDF22DRAFT_89497 [Syncephalis plumigaleata]